MGILMSVDEGNSLYYFNKTIKLVFLKVLSLEKKKVGICSLAIYFHYGREIIENR